MAVLYIDVTPYQTNITLGNTEQRGNAFEPTSAFSPSFAFLYCHSKAAAPTSSVAGYIYGTAYVSDSGEYVPTGTALDSGSISALVTGWNQVSFSKTASLLTSTWYALIWDMPNSNDDDDRYYVGKDDNIHTGIAYTYGGAVLSAYSFVSTQALMMQLYGSGIEAPAPILYGDKHYNKRLVAVANDQVWYESSPGTMSEITAARGDFDTTYPVTLIEGYQKAFLVNISALKVIDFANARISTADVGNYAPRKGNILTGGTTSASFIVDYADSITSSAACVIYGYPLNTIAFTSGETVTGTAANGTAISFAVASAQGNPPHWYTWTTYGNSSAYGTMPDKATFGCLYRGRLVLAGNPGYPHQWYMSRVADPFNWLYDSSDPLSAVAGNNTDAGELGDIVLATIPLKDDYLIFGCANSMWYLAGDPLYGGEINELDLKTGIYSFNSWCIGPNDTIFFFGSNGIYKTQFSPQPSPPINISQLVLPKLVEDEGIDKNKHIITIGYDNKRRGIVICKSVISTEENSCYFFDLKTEGFYPESYPIQCSPTAMFNYEAIAEANRDLLVGCADGFIRYFNNSSKNDNIGTSSAAISAFLVLPIENLSGDEDVNGKLTSLTFINAGGASSGDFGDSDGFVYKIFKDDDAETVLENIVDGDTAFISGVITTTGRQTKKRIKVKGNYIGIQLINDTIDEAFVINKVVGDVKPAGHIR